MDWEMIGAVGEILGATGVIVTLVYLASQIRQNTKAMRSQALQSLAEAGASMNAMVVGDGDVARIFRSGMTDEYDNLTQNDRTRFVFLIAQWVLTYESVYLQHQLDTIDDELFASRMENLKLWLNTKGGQRAWNASRQIYSRGYVEYIQENVIQEH